MEVVNLSGKIRNKTGRGPCNSLRNHSSIPGILYGREHQNVLVEFSEMELNDVIKHHGEHAIVNVNIDDSKAKAMIKEVQRDPVNRKLTHIDMKYVKDDEKIHADIPVVLKGEDIIASKGGIVQKQITYLTVESKPDKLPQYIVGDISKLNIGGRLTVADVEISSDITIAQDIHSIIAAVISARETAGDAENNQV